MSLSPLRAVLRRHFQSALRQRPQHRTQSSSSSPPPNSSPHNRNQDKIANQAAGTSAPVQPRPLWQRLGPLTKAAEAYGRSQRKRPYATQVASALFIYFCADISAQNISGNDYDPKRTGRSLIIGAVAAIPQYRWFIFLSQNFNYSSRMLSLSTKVVVNQLVFSPTFNTYFFSSQALLAGEGIDATIERVKNALPPSLINSWKLWPAVTFFSFSFVPMEYRSVCAGVVAVGWQTYLCYLNRMAELMEKAKRAESLRLENIVSVKERKNAMAATS